MSPMSDAKPSEGRVPDGFTGDAGVRGKVFRNGGVDRTMPVCAEASSW